MSQTAQIIRTAEQPKHWLLAELVTPLVKPLHTGNRYSILHAVVRQGCGSPPHVHHREDEGFYIISGEVTFLYGDAMLVAGPGSFVWAPRDVPHNFTCTSAEPATMLAISTPTGFDRFIEGFMRPAPDVNQWPPVRPQDVETIMRTAPDFGIEMLPGHAMPTTTRLAETATKRLWVMGEQVSYLATSAQTAGEFTVVEIQTAPGGGPPPHAHVREDEIMYVLDGRHEVEMDGRVEIAGPGDLVWMPRGTKHRYSNVGPTPGKLLSLHTPGGFEQFFDEVGVDAAEHATPPLAPPPPPKVLEALLSRHGMTV